MRATVTFFFADGTTDSVTGMQIPPLAKRFREFDSKTDQSKIMKTQLEYSSWDEDIDGRRSKSAIYKDYTMDAMREHIERLDKNTKAKRAKK